MGATNQNKIDSIASRPENATFHVPELPSLSEQISLFGLKEGASRWDAKGKEWTRNLEREINARLGKAQSISPGAPG